jgi:hypothetical protein
MPNLTLHDPTGVPAGADRAPSASLRLDRLAGARIALLKNAWPSWHDMADRLGERLAADDAVAATPDFQIPNGSAADPTLIKEIAAEVDAAVVGLANCGSCTAWSYHDAMELRRLGTPVVLMVTREFVGLATAIGTSKGHPLPMVVLEKNPETIERTEAVAMLEAAYDEVTRRLTEETAGGDAAAATPDAGAITAPDDDAAQEDLYRRGWTDGLPVILPTAPRVDRMLAATDHDPDDVVAAMPPSDFAVTYEKLAVNAVMAGCEPAHLPALAAAVSAVCDPAFNLNGIATTTGPSTPMIVVSGPARTRLGVNTGRGALGHGTRANAAIGRALRLLITNVGGARPGDISKSIMGQPGRYTFCFGENEEASPWEPWHVTRGLDPAQSAVTAFGATGSMNLLTPRQDVEAMLTLLADGLAFMGNPNVVMGKGTTVVAVSPGHARAMADAGLSKADVAREIWQRAGIPIERFPASAYPDASYSFVERDGVVYPALGPENIAVLVVGGPEPTHATLIPAHPSCVPVTRAFETGAGA